MTAKEPLVLLTGATGFLGFLILIDLLKSGYSVHIVVRSEDKINKIRAHPLVTALGLPPDRFSFVVIPDLTARGAFDVAVEGVDYIIHLAAPVPSFGAGNPVAPEQYEKYFVQDAVAGTLGMLQSAAAAGRSLKRVVLTSSAVAVIPFAYLAASPDVDYSVTFGPESRQPTPAGPFSNEVEAYSAGKTAVLNAAEKWIGKNGGKVGFDLVTTLPAWTFGRDELVSSAEDLRASGTNSVLLGLLLGNKSEWPFNGNAVLGTDVARVHVLALDPKVKGNQSFVVSTPIVWQDAVEVVRSEFPADVEAGSLSVDGKQPTQAINFDGSKTEEVLGIKFSPFQEAVRGVAGQYLELLGLA